jgi:ferrochelatase
MPTHQTTPLFEHEIPVSTGVLVVNLGTPKAPTTAAVRHFLRQFLSDPRVVEFPRLIWWFILNLVVLVIRPAHSARAYRKIWTERGSPLLVHSEAIANKLRERLIADARAAEHLELAMTYGDPSIRAAIDKLVAKGVRRIITLPLYPQYSHTTTAAVSDAVERELGRLDDAPEVLLINNYHDAPGYIAALAASIRDDWTKNGRGDKLLMSFHGIPKKMVRNGDPYYDQCQQTARLLADELSLSDADWQLSFQSRVGREAWLEPYTEETVRALGEQKLSRIDVVCPGFSTDCLETLEEIAMQNRDFFTAAGGEAFHYIPALNAREDLVRFLADLIAQHLSDSVEGTGNASQPVVTDHATATGGAV